MAGSFARHLGRILGCQEIPVDVVISKYPATTVALVGLFVFAAVLLILAAPGLHADPAQVAILVGVFVLAIQQVVSQRTNEANGHRLTAVENVAATATTRLDAADVAVATATPPDDMPTLDG